jgi:hypothetical protein
MKKLNRLLAKIEGRVNEADNITTDYIPMMVVLLIGLVIFTYIFGLYDYA